MKIHFPQRGFMVPQRGTRKKNLNYACKLEAHDVSRDYFCRENECSRRMIRGEKVSVIEEGYFTEFTS